jgi:tetratricopeptide (TPR) repeat protein
VGMVKYQQSYYAEASEWFLRALNINPGAENVLLNFHDACLQLGNSYAVRPQLEKALLYNPQSQILKMITQELQGAANNSLEVQKLSQLRHFNSEVERYLREGMLAQARQKLTEVLDLDPLYYRTLNNWGISAWLERDFAAAYNYFKQAVLANPWFLDALSNLYNSAVQLQNTKDIPEVLALVARVNGDNADFIEIKNRINQGQATGFAPPLDVEAQAWEQASLQVQRGYELLDQGEIDKAILLFGEVLDQHPRHIDALNGMGIGAFHRGNVEDAYAIFKQAVEFYPLDNDSLKNLWDAAQQVGQNAQALIYLENAVAVDSNLAEIRQIIESQGEW